MLIPDFSYHFYEVILTFDEYFSDILNIFGYYYLSY